MAGGLTLHVHPTGDLLDATLQCEADVFGEWFGNNREQLAEEYAPYDAATTFIAVTDSAGEVVAASRNIFPSPAGHKTLHDAAQPPWSLDVPRAVNAMRLKIDSTLDITTVAVRAGLRGGTSLVSAAMFHGMLALVGQNDVTHMLSLMDEKVRGRMDLLSLRFHAMPGASPAGYLGSPASTPIWASFPVLLGEQRRDNPEAYRLVTLGQGLDGVSMPPRAAFRWTPRVGVVDLRDAALAGRIPGQRHVETVLPG